MVAQSLGRARRKRLIPSIASPVERAVATEQRRCTAEEVRAQIVLAVCAGVQRLQPGQVLLTQRLAPGRDLTTGLAQYPVAELADQSGLLGERHEGADHLRATTLWTLTLAMVVGGALAGLGLSRATNALARAGAERAEELAPPQATPANS